MSELTFQLKLLEDVIRLKNIEHLIGKYVRITIQELSTIPEQKRPKKWTRIGSVKLNKKLDNINIRDFAYE